MAVNHGLLIMNRSVRLSDLIAQDLDVSIWCQDCGRHRLMTAKMLGHLVRPQLAMSQVQRRFRCGACNSRAVHARPHYASLGVVANHSWKKPEK
jgi:hypothetical protein